METCPNRGYVFYSENSQDSANGRWMFLLERTSNPSPRMIPWLKAYSPLDEFDRVR